MTSRLAVIDVALAPPLLVVLVAGAVDVGRYVTASQRIAAVATEAALSGALADSERGEDAVAIATEVAHSTWASTGLPGTFTVYATLEGAAPNQRIVVETTVDAPPVLHFVRTRPRSPSATRMVRLSDQE